MDKCRACSSTYNTLVPCLCAGCICVECLNNKRFNSTIIQTVVSCDICKVNYRMVKRTKWCSYYYMLMRDILFIILGTVAIVVMVAYLVGCLDSALTYEKCITYFICKDLNRPILHFFLPDSEMDTNLNFIYIIFSIILSLAMFGFMCTVYDCCTSTPTSSYTSNRRSSSSNDCCIVINGDVCPTNTNTSNDGNRNDNLNCCIVMMFLCLIFWASIGIFYSMYYGVYFFYHRSRKYKRELLIKTAIESYPVLDIHECDQEQGDIPYAVVADEILEIIK